VADIIQTFCNKYISKNMVFEACRDVENPEIKSLAYISRNNSSLIEKMIDLDLIGQPYNLIREAKSIFELMLFLMFLKPNNKNIYNEDYIYIQNAYDEYSSDDALKKYYKGFFNYAREEFSDDINLSSAINTILTHTRDVIFKTYENAKAHEKEKTIHYVTLGTAHSTKGGEFDAVELAPDLKRTFEKCLESQEKFGHFTAEDIQELNLIYVAASRARYKLYSADWMTR
jgi:superfamily I DNA/RNA helicase